MPLYIWNPTPLAPFAIVFFHLPAFIPVTAHHFKSDGIGSNVIYTFAIQYQICGTRFLGTINREHLIQCGIWHFNFVSG